MGLFDKKYCGVCGQKIGLFGNRKLEDANLCKDCAAKLSPWFSDRRQSTLAEIKDQLAYREANKEKVAAFHPTLTLGKSTKVLIDEDAERFIVTSARNWQDTNPDVIDFADVTGCELDINESKRELKTKDAQGNQVSYNPPRYEFSHDFYCEINLNNPYFNQIRFRINPSTIHSEATAVNRFRTVSAPLTVEYQECKDVGEQIKHALLDVRQKARDAVAAAAAANEPKKPVVCPFCGATTTPNASGCCEYCGAPIA